MSLPTAQLGSLPSINLPNYVPGPSYKPANPWVQAITAMLANAGTTAGEGLVNNELSSDNAKEFGKQDATGWDRLLHGPAVSDKEAMQLRGQSADRENLAMSGQLADSRQAALLEAEGERAKQTQRAETLRSREGNASRERDFSSNLDRELATSDRTQASMDKRARAELAAKAPLTAAQVAEAQAIARYHDAQTALQNKTTALIPDPKAPPTAGQVNPNIASFAKNGPQGSSSGVVPGSSTNTDAQTVQEWLNRGVPQEQIPQIMQAVATRQANVQDSADAAAGIDAQKAATQKALVQQILLRLHPEQNPSNYPSLFGMP